MRTALQVFFGLIMGATGVAVPLYLGLLANGHRDWRTGLVVLLLLAATQWLSFFAFRHRIALQVLFGSVLCMATVIWLTFYSSLPIFWEHEDPQPHVYSITWRSGVMFLLLLTVTQAISFFFFRWIGTAIHSSFQETPNRKSSRQ
jgi:uncharacterized membrane protein